MKRIYYFFVKLFKKVSNKKVSFGKGSRIHKTSSFEGNNKIMDRTFFKGRIGFGSYIGSDCIIDAKIGRFCSISNKVVVVQGLHPTSTFVSTHPSFYSSIKQSGFSFVTFSLYNEFRYADINNKHAVIIGNDVWIGYGALIMAGITIGDGAIIGAGAVVTHNVLPYEIVGGCPAKTIKKRFDDSTIDYLLKFKWWDKDLDWIKSNAPSFLSVKSFLNINTFNKEPTNE